MSVRMNLGKKESVRSKRKLKESVKKLKENVRKLKEKEIKEKKGHKKYLLYLYMTEPVLKEEIDRFVVLPVNAAYQDLWDMYKYHQKMFWVAEEIDYPADKNDWESLSDDERFFIKRILAFFAGSDGIVIENLVTNFCNEVKISEARAFYTFQAAMEQIHSETYALLIDTFIKDKQEKKELFNAIENFESIKKKADWSMKWISSEQPFVNRLIAFAVVEGIFFSGAFCSIFWLKSKGKMVKALGHSNELIARDEGLHTQFAVLLYKKLINKPTQETVFTIVKEAVTIEKEFICDSIPCDLIGMNKVLMSEYIEFVADRLVQQLGFNKIYGSKCPFDFMEQIGLDGKTNFFEKRVSEYQLSGFDNEEIVYTVEDDDDF